MENSPSSLIKHFVSFKQTLSEEAFKSFVQLQLFHEQQWDLSSQYSVIKLPQFFPHVTMIKAKRIFLGENNCPNILKDIVHIEFPFLRILSLSENRISTIELLSRMALPCLEGLNLFDNCITSIAPLQRLFAPNLFVVSLEQNFITDFSYLYLSPFHKSLRQLGVNYMQHTLCSDDLSWFFKIENMEFKQLWIGEYNRLLPKSFVSAGLKRFKNLKMITCIK